MTPLVRFALVGGLQAAVILGWAGYHQHLYNTAPTIRLPLRGQTPFDVLRGRYMKLNLADARLDSRDGALATVVPRAVLEAALHGEGSYRGKLWAGFCRRGDVHRLCALSRPEGPRDAAGVEFWVPAHGSVRLYSYHPENAGRWSWDPQSQRQVETLGPFPEPSQEVRAELDLVPERFYLPERVTLPRSTFDPGYEIEVIYRPNLPLLLKRLWYEGKPVELE